MVSKQRKRPYAWALIHVCAWLLTWCLAERASAAPSAAERDTARALLDEGDRLLAAGELTSAMERYRGAHAIMHVPTSGLDLARVQAQLGLLVEARATAMEVVNLPPQAAEPAVFQEARSGALSLVQRLLQPRVPSLQLRVTPAGTDYRVSVDGLKVPREARSLPFRTNPGPHSVRVEARGFEPAQRDIVLAEGRALQLPSSLLARERRPARGRAAEAADCSGLCAARGQRAAGQKRRARARHHRPGHRRGRARRGQRGRAHVARDNQT